MSAQPQLLTPGEWEALLFQAPKQVHALVVKLAVFHNHLQPCQPAECPLCGKGSDAPEQLALVEALP